MLKRAAVVAAAVAVAAVAQTWLVIWVTGSAPSGPRSPWGYAFPAFLWVCGTPGIMALGHRFPARRPRTVRDLGIHALAFSAWFALTNLLVRLPALSGRDPGWLLPDTLEGMVRFAPASVLLYALITWAGAGARPEAKRAQEETTSALPSPADSPTALAIPGLNRIRLVPAERIRYLVADGDYVSVHTLDDVHRFRATLRELERRLALLGAFVRIHRSSLVNVRHVREVQPLEHGDYVAVMTDGAELRIPRTRRPALERLLGNQRETD